MLLKRSLIVAVALAVAILPSVARAQAAGGNYGVIGFAGGPLQLQLLAVDGTISAPAYSFASQPNTGMRLVGNGIVFTNLGNNVGYFNSTLDFEVYVPVLISGGITSNGTGDIGWSIQTAANQACNTTCTFACVHGWDTASGEVAVSCSSATADKCLCAGAN